MPDKPYRKMVKGLESKKLFYIHDYTKSSISKTRKQ